MICGRKKWCDAQHFFYEYYCPYCGWIKGMSERVLYVPKNCIMLRINYQNDENIAGNAFDYYGGCIPWFWIDNEKIWLGFPKGARFYKKKKGWGRSINRGFIVIECITISENVDRIKDISHKVWNLFIKYFGLKLDGENKHCFDKSLELQKKSIEHLKKSDVNKFIENMSFAYKEYKKIRI